MKTFLKARSVWKFLSNLAAFYFYYYFSPGQLAASTSQVNTPFVYFNIQSKLSERHYSYLLFCFNQAGIAIRLKNSLHFFGNISTYSKQIATLNLLKIVYVPPDPKDCLLMISDINTDQYRNYKYKLTLDISVFEKNKLRGSNQILPFFMIPRLYFSGTYHQARSLCTNSRRKFKIFFSGNLNPDQYNSSKFKLLFNKLTRIEIIDALENGLNSDQILTLEEVKDNEIYFNRFVYSAWSRKSMKQVNINGRIENPEWLQILSKVDFFLACPGFIQPMCHNVIEAMSVGAIPILEHPEFFNPPLTNGHNAIVFSGREDLLIKIKEVLDIEVREIKKLRANVLNYYNEVLSPDAIVSDLMNQREHRKKMYLIESAYFWNLPVNG